MHDLFSILFALEATVDKIITRFYSSVPKGLKPDQRAQFEMITGLHFYLLQQIENACTLANALMEDDE